MQFTDKSEVIHLVPQEQHSKCKTEGIKDVLVSSAMEETDEVLKLVPQMSQSDFEEHFLKESVRTVIPQVMEEVFERAKPIPQKQCLTRQVEQVASPQHFISTVQDVSGHSNGGTESANRCTHEMCYHDI